MKKIAMGVMAALALGWSGRAGAAPAAGTPAPSLDDCVKTALDRSPDTAAAAGRIEAARAGFRQARSAWYPLVSAGGGYQITDNPPQAFMMELNQRALNMADPGFNPNEPDSTDDLRLSVGAKYRLYDAGRRTADGRMASSGLDAAEAGEAAVRNELVHQVTRGYYAVLQAQAFVRVQEEAVASLEESLRVAQARHTAGSAAKTDVLNLEVKLAESREDLVRARNGVQLGVAALNTAIGQDLVGPGGLTEAAEAAEPPLPEPPADDAANARPEVRVAEAMADLRKSGVTRARRDFAPTINAFGSYDWDSGDLSGFEGSYLGGVMAEWDVFDGFRKSQAVREARARASEADAQLEKARRQVRLDLKQAWLQAQEARERLGVTRKSEESAAESLRITRARYEQGAADITELLTAQVGATAIRTRRAAAYYDYLAALSNVRRAKGELAQEAAAARPRN